MTEDDKKLPDLGRRSLIASALALLAARPAMAQDSMLRSVVAQLERQGYEVESVKRTWLGRVRVIARSSSHTREIVYVPTTGEVLRDYWEPNQGSAGSTSPGNTGSTTGNSGSGSRGNSGNNGNSGNRSNSSNRGNSGNNGNSGSGGGNSGTSGGGGEVFGAFALGIHGIEPNVDAAVRFIAHKPFVGAVAHEINTQDVRGRTGVDPAVFENVGAVVRQMQRLDVQHLAGLLNSEPRHDW